MATTALADSALIAHQRGENLIDYFRRRGYLQDLTDEAELRRAFDEDQVTAYIGFDPTAPSLHVGHLIGIMTLGVLQRFGHRPIALGGGGTALVGDPSGKTSTRNVLTAQEIEENMRKILPQFRRYLDFAGGQFGGNPPALLMNNADWLLELKYIDFLRDIGRHFSVNEMLAVETYKNRIESGSGLNFVEFNYRLVQSYDFLHLYQATGCTLQMGGSDQWGNIVAGVDLIRRVESAKAFGLVTPLLTTASGDKMGKSEGNSVWLDPDLVSPFDYYQYWINVDDQDVKKLLNIYTFLPDETISEALAAPDMRVAKRLLALEATALTHGREAAIEADAAAQSLFAERSVSDALEDEGIPLVEISRDDLGEMTLAEAFVRSGLVASRGEGRRLAEQGGLSVDGERVSDIDQLFSPANEKTPFQVGKKRFRRIGIVDSQA